MPKMPFRTPEDFAPVSLLVTVPELLVVTPTFPAKTVAELVAMNGGHGVGRVGVRV